MDPELEEFFVKFLAKNKYPEIKRGIVKIELDDHEIIHKLNDADKIKDARTKTDLDYLVLSWHFMGWNNNVRDLKKAEYWANSGQITQVCHVINLILCYLATSDDMSYKLFLEKYQSVLERLVKIDLSERPEIAYRIYKLLSGWVYDHDEYQLSED